jgi:hypothetical protein
MAYGVVIKPYVWLGIAAVREGLISAPRTNGAQPLNHCPDLCMICTDRVRNRFDVFGNHWIVQACPENPFT